MATGTYTITVTGTGGSTTHTTTAALTVTAAAAPDFAISASPTSVPVVQGNSGSSTVSTTVTGGFNSSVSLSASGQPSGVTVSFNPTSIAAPGSGSSTMTMAVASSTATGTYTITVTGTGGSTTHTATVSLSVTAAGGLTAAYDTTLKAPKCAQVGSSCDSGASLLLGRATLGPEPNKPNTINSACTDGTSGTFHSDESNDRLKVFTTDGSNFAPGKQVTVQATVWAYSSFSSDHLDLYYASNASSPTWTLIATLNPTVAGSQVLSANYTLPSGGSLQAVRANFRYQGSASSCSTGAYDDHDDLIFAVTSTPDFSMSASPTSVSVVQGSSGSSTISTTVSGGFNSSVSLSASGQPSGVTVSFSPASIAAPGSGTSTMSITVGSAAATGTYPITVTASGGSVTHTTSVSLTVTASGGAATLFSDGFESTGWSTTQVSGTAGSWSLVSSSSHPSISAHGGTKWADFNSYTSASGSQTRIYRATGFAVPSTYTTVTLTFWMYHDTGYSTYADKVQPQISANATTWTNLGSAIARYNGTTGWAKVTIDVSSYKGSTVYLGFVGISAFGNDEYLDDVSVAAQ